MLPARDPRQTTFSRLIPVMVTALGGALVGCLMAPFLLQSLDVIAWRRPVQDWLTAMGFGRYAPYYAIFNLHWVDIFLAGPAGFIIGFIGYRRWVRCVLVYVAGYVLTPLAVFLLSGPPLPPARLWLYAVDLVCTALAVAPLAFLAGWVVSRGKRRREARRNAGACLECGYNLQGNVTGRCPECGNAAV